MAEWNAEFNRLQDEFDALRFDNVAAFEHIRHDYAPELLAHVHANKAQAIAEAIQAEYLARLQIRETTLSEGYPRCGGLQKLRAPH